MVRWIALLCVLALPAMAGGTLEGRIVTLNVETWDDPANPMFVSKGRTVKVGAGVEFGMGPEYSTPGFDVAPVQVEITPQRIEFSYPEGLGYFARAAFNGYVLRFVTDCALIEKVTIDEGFTTMPVTMADIRVEGGALFVNVAGRIFSPQMRIGLDLAVGDCLLG